MAIINLPVMKYFIVLLICILSINAKKVPSLDEQFRDFNWNSLYTSNNYDLVDNMLDRLTPIIINSVGPSKSNYVAPTPIYNCQDPRYSHLLTGRVLANPKTIIAFMPFFIELELLEIRLYEHIGLVDYTIIYESTHTHRGRKKALFYNETKHLFEQFSVIHLLEGPYGGIEEINTYKDGGCSISSSPNEGCWAINQKMWERGYTKFRQHSVFNQLYSQRENTLVIVGDLDEIISRSAVAHLKYCEVKSLPIHGASNMYMRSFEWLYHSDFPTFNPKEVGNPLRQYSLAFPLITTLDRIISANSFTRYSDTHLYLPLNSGAHMTDFGGIVNFLYKRQSAAEGGIANLTPYLNDLIAHNYDHLENVFKSELANNYRTVRRSQFNFPSPSPSPPPPSTVEGGGGGEGLFIPWIVRADPLKYSHLF